MRFSVILRVWRALPKGPLLLALIGIYPSGGAALATVSAKDIPVPCNFQESQPVAFDDLIKTPEAFIGRCVRVAGMKSGWFLYDGIAGYFAAQNQDRASAIASNETNLPRTFIAVSVENDDLNQRLSKHATYAEVSGRATECTRLREEFDASQDEEERLENEERRARGEGEIMLVGGGYRFCDTDSGPVVFVSAARLFDGPDRMTASDPGSDALRDLVLADEGWAPYHEVKKAVEEWFDAVRRRDTEAFIKASADSKARDLNVRWKLAYQVFVDPASPMRFLFGQNELPPITYFRRASVPGEQPDTFIAGGCVCKTADCSREWPIHSMNLTFEEDWPFACIWVEGEGGKIFVGRNY